jgi:hypothetical protein
MTMTSTNWLAVSTAIDAWEITVWAAPYHQFMIIEGESQENPDLS